MTWLSPVTLCLRVPLLRVRRLIEGEIHKDIKRGQLVPGDSAWGSPAFRVMGKKPRMVVDYRKVNSLTVRAVFLMPSTEGVKSRVMGREWLSTGDGVAGFNQIENSYFAQLCLAITSLSGKYLPQSLVFGPQNGPEDFGRFTFKIFRGKLYKVWFFFVDDTVIATGWCSHSNKEVKEFANGEEAVAAFLGALDQGALFKEQRSETLEKEAEGLPDLPVVSGVSKQLPEQIMRSAATGSQERPGASYFGQHQDRCQHSCERDPVSLAVPPNAGPERRRRQRVPSSAWSLSHRSGTSSCMLFMAMGH